MINYHLQRDINNNSKYEITKYKNSFSLTFTSCDGRGCYNAATPYLKIFCLNKPGFFCDTCKRELEEKNLVESILATAVDV